jgi:hypothetical protein
LCTYKLINHISNAGALSTARQKGLKLEQGKSVCISFSTILLRCAEFPIGKTVSYWHPITFTGQIIRTHKYRLNMVPRSLSVPEGIKTATTNIPQKTTNLMQHKDILCD